MPATFAELDVIEEIRLRVGGTAELCRSRRTGRCLASRCARRNEQERVGIGTGIGDRPVVHSWSDNSWRALLSDTIPPTARHFARAVFHSGDCNHDILPHRYGPIVVCTLHRHPAVSTHSGAVRRQTRSSGDADPVAGLRPGQALHPAGQHLGEGRSAATISRRPSPRRSRERVRKKELSPTTSRDPKKPQAYIVYERWLSVAAIESHLQTDHIKTLNKALPEMLDGTTGFSSPDSGWRVKIHASHRTNGGRKAPSQPPREISPCR